jgi:hypothetical protein
MKTPQVKQHPDAFYEWLKGLGNDFDYDVKVKWSSRLWKDKRSVNEILSEDLGLIPEECKRNGHRDTGRGVCAECETFLPSSDGEHWA